MFNMEEEEVIHNDLFDFTLDEHHEMPLYNMENQQNQVNNYSSAQFEQYSNELYTSYQPQAYGYYPNNTPIQPFLPHFQAQQPHGNEVLTNFIDTHLEEDGLFEYIDGTTFHSMTKRRAGSDMDRSMNSITNPETFFSYSKHTEHKSTSSTSTPTSASTSSSITSTRSKRKASESLYDFIEFEQEEEALELETKKKSKRGNGRDARTVCTDGNSNKKNGKQKRTKWGSDEVEKLWEGIRLHGNNWRLIKKRFFPNRTYYQVKDKGRRILSAEAWSSGRTKATHDQSSDEAKNIAIRVLQKKNVVLKVEDNNEELGENMLMGKPALGELELGLPVVDFEHNFEGFDLLH